MEILSPWTAVDGGTEMTNQNYVMTLGFGFVLFLFFLVVVWFKWKDDVE